MAKTNPAANLLTEKNTICEIVTLILTIGGRKAIGLNRIFF